MRRRIDHLRVEGEAFARVDVGHNRLELLRDEPDKVHAPVAIQIHWSRLYPARTRIDDVLRERRAAVIDRLVREHGHAAYLAPAEGCHREIHPAVPIEV